MYMKKYILLFCIVFSPLLVVAQEAQHILKLWQGNTFVEYNIDNIDSITFETQFPQPEYIGEFSVSSNKKVSFSPGNLMYIPASDAWIFAANQYDYIGTRNLVNKEFADTIDLFAWSTDSSPLSAWGVTLLEEDSLFSGNFVDWGTALGEDSPWRTLTSKEWEYLRASRKNAAKLIGIGSINGIHGLILLPDNWQAPEGITFQSGYSSKEYSSVAFEEYQSFTLDQWATMQAAGAVFLPCAGFRMGTTLAYMQLGGMYWTSSINSSYGTRFAHYFLFMCDGAGMGTDTRWNGNAVRLVRDL